jgi:hypothetical protein
VKFHWSLVYLLLCAAGLSFSSEVMFISGNYDHLLTESVVCLDAVLLNLSNFRIFCVFEVF